MSQAQCQVVELALAAADFPDRLSWAALFACLPALGKLKCIEFAIAPAGGGHLSFVVHDAASDSSVRDGLRKLVGDDAIVRCVSRPA